MKLLVLIIGLSMGTLTRASDNPISGLSSVAGYSQQKLPRAN